MRKALLIAAAMLAGPAAAHVTLQPAGAPAGGYQVLRFSLGHGCESRATNALRIEIPPSVTIAHPQPKPGWTLAVEHPAGRPDLVSAIVWRGDLPADQFDEFLIHARLPAATGPLTFPATQTCGPVEVRWTETAAPGAPRPQHPAPVIVLSPPAVAPAPANP